nr:hypothetical protein [Ichthyobacterium seriolicida]
MAKFNIPVVVLLPDSKPIKTLSPGPLPLALESLTEGSVLILPLLSFTRTLSLFIFSSNTFPWLADKAFVGISVTKSSTISDIFNLVPISALTQIIHSYPLNIAHKVLILRH